MIWKRNGIETERRTVRLYGRTFVVRVNLDGTARSILERKVRDDGTIRDDTYWHFSQPLPGSGKGAPSSVVRSVLDRAGAGYEHLLDERLAA